MLNEDLLKEDLLEEESIALTDAPTGAKIAAVVGGVLIGSAVTYIGILIKERRKKKKESEKESKKQQKFKEISITKK